MNQAFQPDQPIVLIDATTGQRQLIWTELDSNATSPDETDLLIRVGKNLKEGHRYIVAMRNMTDRRAGRRSRRRPGSRSTATTSRPTSRRSRSAAQHFESIFKTLRTPGSRATTSTTPGTSPSRARATSPSGCSHPRRRTRPARRQRRRATGSSRGTRRSSRSPTSRPSTSLAGTRASDLAVTDPSHAVQNVREVTGTFQVPCYLNQVGCPSGSRFNLGADGLPQQTPGNFYTRDFTCNIPQSAVREQTPGPGDFGRPPGPAVDVRARAVRRLHARSTPANVRSSAPTTA